MNSHIQSKSHTIEKHGKKRGLSRILVSVWNSTVNSFYIDATLKTCFVAHSIIIITFFGKIENCNGLRNKFNSLLYFKICCKIKRSEIKFSQLNMNNIVTMLPQIVYSIIRPNYSFEMIIILGSSELQDTQHKQIYKSKM